MMTQKAFQVGSSVAITLPKEVRETLHIKAGDSVHTDFDKKNEIFSVMSAGKLSPKDEEVLQHAVRFMKRYKKDLKALAK